MSKYQDRAMELRHDPTFHYNCAQAVLMPFSEKLGLTEAQAQDLGSLFAGGMYCGATCGAITGALMVLGLAGQKDPVGRDLVARFEARYGARDCVPLIAKAKEQGGEPHEFCNAMIREAIAMVEETLGE